MPGATLLYDVRNEPAPVTGVIRGGAAGAFVGALLLALVWKRRDRAPKLFAVLWMLGCIAFAAWNAFEIRRLHRAAQEVLSGGRVDVVEGVVEDHSIPPLERSGPETFRVGAVVFRLEEGTKSPGLSRGAKGSETIRSGARLRVTHQGGAILRLESLPRVGAPAP